MTADVADTLTARPPAKVAPLSLSDRWRILLFGGGLLILVNFSGPMNGFIDVPVSFFLKNRMHLTANQLAVFKVWVGAPLFLSFVFGFIRDRWSPFRAGDRGHVALFGLVTATTYAAIAFITPTYMVFLLGLVIATITFQMVSSAAAGLIAAIGQTQAMAGQMGALVNIGTTLPALCAFLVGGVLSGALEGRDAVTAAKTVFLCAAGLMILIAVFGLAGPKALFVGTGATPAATTIRADIRRLLKHWPVYPVMLIQVLWQFGPASGTVLQYHITNHLHASDAQWGAWNAIFIGSFLPVFVIYGFLCQRVRLSRLLWWGFGLGVVQMAPLLFVKTAIGALIAAVPMGLIGGVAQAALVDLTIRACPKGLRATMMMLIISMYWVATRFGDLFGTWIYDGHGGFKGAVIATIIVYALILPVIFFLPRSLIDTTDGEPLEIKG
jgi:MFS family permease